MASSLGTEHGKTVNVEINIVPFIDLMSCLTAFLLVTAAWVSIARIDITPQGRARDAVVCEPGDPCDDPKLSILVEPDQVWLGVSRINSFERVPRLPDGRYDWAKVEALLREHKKSANFKLTGEVEIAGLSIGGKAIRYQELVAAMDVAIKAGFDRPGLTDPDGLSARPTL